MKLVMTLQVRDEENKHPRRSAAIQGLPMKIITVLAVRNEQIYLANSLRHLIDNGISFALFDNASTDRTRQIILREEFRSHLVSVKDISFDSTFDLTRQLAAKIAFVQSSDADWVSVIIPTKNQAELLERCVRGVLTATDYPSLDVTIVDNDSEAAETTALFV
jgi:glycosyltransferase involved in cell wall biosynthesis